MSMKIRSAVVTMLLAGVLVLLGGCQQLSSLEEQQATLQEDLDSNAQEMAEQLKQARAGQRQLTEAMITVCDEYRDLKQQVNEQYQSQEQALNDLLQRLKTQQAAYDQAQQTWQTQITAQGDVQQEAMTQLRTELGELTKQLQGLVATQQQSAVQQSDQQEKVMAQLNDAVQQQGTLAEGLVTVQQGLEKLTAQLTELQKSQGQDREQIKQLEQGLANLQNRVEANTSKIQATKDQAAQTTP